MACPCFAREGAREPVWTRGHGGAGLQFLNWSCRRQPSHRLAASPLSLHLKGGPRSIHRRALTKPSGIVRPVRGAIPYPVSRIPYPVSRIPYPVSLSLPFTNGNGPRGRCRSVSASPDVTPRHARRAHEGPWRFVASSDQLYNLCKWMPKALATELGARTAASGSCAVPTWHTVPASGWCCRRQPRALYTALMLQIYCAQGLCEIACPCFAREGATEPFWTRGYRAAVLELELPKAALSPPGRFTAEPPPEGWSSLYPYHLQMGTVRMASRSVPASPDVTPRHPHRTREGPWRSVASSVQLCSLCEWMPKALAKELGARTVASRRFAVPTCRAVPASGWWCRRQPAPCTPPSSSVTPRCLKITVLMAFMRWLARALLARAPPSRCGLVVTGVPGCNS